MTIETGSPCIMRWVLIQGGRLFAILAERVGAYSGEGAY